MTREIYYIAHDRFPHAKICGNHQTTFQKKRTNNLVHSTKNRLCATTYKQLLRVIGPSPHQSCNHSLRPQSSQQFRHNHYQRKDRHYDQHAPSRALNVHGVRS